MVQKEVVIFLVTILLVAGCQDNQEISSEKTLDSLDEKLEASPNEKKGDLKEQIDDVSVTSYTSKLIAGTFRCWSYNVEGAGKSCTSPPLILLEDGSYSMSSEKGTYFIDENIITLSESRLRGPGKILEDGNQIRFEYDYNDWHHTLTYARQGKDTSLDDSGEKISDEQFVEVTLTLNFPYEAGGITSVQLIAQSEELPAGETLAYEVAENTIEAVFRKYEGKSGIMTGKVYDVMMSSGFSPWKVGEVDLTETTGDVEITIEVEEE